MKKNFTSVKMILAISLLMVCFYNISFFKRVFAVYPVDSTNAFHLVSVVIFLFFATNVFLLLVFSIFDSVVRLLKFKHSFKTFFGITLFLSMLSAYVMDSFGVVVDETMLLNILKTDAAEARDLFTVKIVIYFVLLFALPFFALKKMQVEDRGLKIESINRGKSFFISLALIFLTVLSSGKFYASFFREQKPLRYYTNPSYWIYTLGKFSYDAVFKEDMKFMAYGRDSKVASNDNDRELIILVLGETARRDRFSLNGYKKETNPLLKKEEVYSFKSVTSCGTSTAISVPCMFSHFGRKNFKVNTALNTENLLDLLSHTKEVSVLWRDNNSDSKGVAVRLPYENYKTSEKNKICDGECRDEGMLVGLQDYINQVKTKDVFIVLHQMGNHGPAYYKRYPKAFEVFKPVCKTSELDKCTNEEIGNGYDNAILYTDYFLSKVIQLLKGNEPTFHTAMYYISDHGESLGENGVYLHGLPYIMAPKEQTEVPMIMWFGEEMKKEVNTVELKKRLYTPYSHDNIFHTVLGIMDVKTSAYDSNLDILFGLHRE